MPRLTPASETCRPRSRANDVQLWTLGAPTGAPFNRQRFEWAAANGGPASSPRPPHSRTRSPSNAFPRPASAPEGHPRLGAEEAPYVATGTSGPDITRSAVAQGAGEEGTCHASALKSALRAVRRGADGAVVPVRHVAVRLPGAVLLQPKQFLRRERATSRGARPSRCDNVRRTHRALWGVGGGGALEPLFQPPPLPPEGGSKGWLSVFHVFHAYSMTKPLALSQPVTVTVSLQREGGGSPYACQPL